MNSSNEFMTKIKSDRLHSHAAGDTFVMGVVATQHRLQVTE